MCWREFTCRAGHRSAFCRPGLSRAAWSSRCWSLPPQGSPGPHPQALPPRCLPGSAVLPGAREQGKFNYGTFSFSLRRSLSLGEDWSRVILGALPPRSGIILSLSFVSASGHPGCSRVSLSEAARARASECGGLGLPCPASPGHPRGHQGPPWARSLWRCGGRLPSPLVAGRMLHVAVVPAPVLAVAVVAGHSLRGWGAEPYGRISGGPCCVWHCPAGGHRAVGACSLLGVSAAACQRGKTREGHWGRWPESLCPNTYRGINFFIPSVLSLKAS